MHFLRLLIGLGKFLFAFVLFTADSAAQLQERPQVPRGPKEPALIMAHYMPWFTANEDEGHWGWHWTMNHFDPSRRNEGRREIASHFYPLIGTYDSRDPLVIEYHLLTMKLSGIDGVIIDWYGREDFRDYAMLHQATMAVVEEADRLGMKFIICYEDQTLGALVEAGKLRSEDKVIHAASELEWLSDNLFNLPGYVRHEGEPVLLSFGQNGLSNEQWSECLERVQTKVAYFSLHHRREAAEGAYDWPLPSEGIAAIDRFEREAKSWPSAISVAFPRFVDIYAQAQLHDSYGMISDEQGRTFRRTLARALALETPIVQLATWNDWGEGTQLEPSVEFGFRDLEHLLSKKQSLDERFEQAIAKDLELPLLLYRACRENRGTAEQREQLRTAMRSLDWAAARQSARAISGSSE